MSRANSCTRETHTWEPSPLPLSVQSNMEWTVPSDAGTNSYSRRGYQPEYNTQPHYVADAIPLFETVPFFDNRAGEITVKLYEVKQLFTQICEYLMYAASIDQTKTEYEYSDDLWIDMPPRSSKKIVMRASYKGRGKPRAILDPLPED